MINSEEGQSYLGHEDGTGLPHLFSATFHRILVSACFVPGRPWRYPVNPQSLQLSRGESPGTRGRDRDRL